MLGPDWKEPDLNCAKKLAELKERLKKSPVSSLAQSVFACDSCVFSEIAMCFAGQTDRI